MSQPVYQSARFPETGSARTLTDTPACCVKVLPGRPDRNGDLLYFGRQGRHPREGHVVQAVIDLVRKDDDLVLQANIGNLLQLLPGVDLANGVVCLSC